MAIQIRPEERDPQRFNDAIRQLVEGRGNNIGTVTLRAGQTTTTVSFPNCSKDCQVFLTPRTANAAAALPSTYISVVSQGSFTITHANAVSVDRTFGYLCIGG